MVINPLSNNGGLMRITKMISKIFYDTSRGADDSVNIISRKTRKELKNEKTRKK